MLGLWAHVELEVTDGVTAVGEEGNLLVQLHPLRLQDLKQAPFRFGVQRLHKAKALARRGLVVLIACEGKRILADNDLKVVLLGLPVPYVAPVNAYGDGAIRDGQGAPIARAALDETPLFLPQLCFTAFGHLQSLMTYGLDVQRHIERQKVREGIDRQAVRDQRRPLGLHEQQLGGNRFREQRRQRAERGGLATLAAAMEQTRAGEREGAEQGPE